MSITYGRFSVCGDGTSRILLSTTKCLFVWVSLSLSLSLSVSLSLCLSMSLSLFLSRLFLSLFLSVSPSPFLSLSLPSLPLPLSLLRDIYIYISLSREGRERGHRATEESLYSEGPLSEPRGPPGYGSARDLTAVCSIQTRTSITPAPESRYTLHTTLCV